MVHQADTIAAVSSPAGRSARAIVRLSGPRAVEIAARLLEPGCRTSPGRLAGFRWMDGALRVPERSALPARIYLMRAPRSYTREDVVELHVAGNPLVAEAVLDAALAAGARLAGPGEFTRRALANGRLSAEQAAAVIELIRARSRAELAEAAAGLSGHRGRELAAWRARAEDLSARMEAELDYGEAGGEFLGDRAAAEELGRLARELESLAAGDCSGRSGRTADAGAVRAALAGAANVGKTLLFTRLTGRAALVSPHPGATRDVLEAPLAAAPADVSVLDTAGLGAPAGEVERLSRQAAERAWRAADILLAVVDRSAPLDVGRLAPALAIARDAETPVVLILNKGDLPAAFGRPEALGALGLRPAAVVEVSALTGAGCAGLAAGLVGLVRSGRAARSGARAESGARRREVLLRAGERLSRAGEALSAGLGLSCAADDLRSAIRTVAGHFEPGAGQTGLDERVFDRLFARFCVGK